MSTAQLFIWGCLGGIVGYVFAYLLPAARGLNDGELQLGRLDASRVVGAIGVALIFVLLGGVAALLVAEQTIKSAIVAGVGFEGTLKAITTKTSPGAS